MSTTLIVALDVPTSEAAFSLVDRIGDGVRWYKVGLELFLNTKGAVIDGLKVRNKQIFLDLKFHDIPHTVAQACAWGAGLGVDMMNVHASGGREMMLEARAAMEAAAAKAGLKAPALIGVTVLTSMRAEGLAAIGMGDRPDDAVVRLAKLVKEAGLDGVVCSSQEVPLIQAAIAAPFLTVCPGIRPRWAAADDQARILTPSEAAARGVTHVVVGRPITKAEHPSLAAQRIIEELMEGK